MLKAGGRKEEFATANQKLGISFYGTNLNIYIYIYDENKFFFFFFVR